MGTSLPYCSVIVPVCPPLSYSVSTLLPVPRTAVIVGVHCVVGELQVAVRPPVAVAPVNVMVPVCPCVSTILMVLPDAVTEAMPATQLPVPEHVAANEPDAVAPVSAIVPLPLPLMPLLVPFTVIVAPEAPRLVMAGVHDAGSDGHDAV